MSGIVGNNTNRGSGLVKSSAVGADSIDGSNIADDAIDSEHYTDGSIDNAHIADDAIDSEHYAAGSIDEAHIADNAVTLAKMAGGTDGNIISYDTSGDPVAIATGNDGQVLTSSGANTQPAFEDAAGGGEELKAWINLNGTGTVAIRDSFNMTSITDNGTGDYTVTIATDFANINYCITAPSAYIADGPPQHHTVVNRYNASGTEITPSVTAFRMSTSIDGLSTDAKYVYAAAFGDQ